MKLATLILAVAVSMPAMATAQSRFNTASPTYRPPAPSNPAPTVIRDYRTGNVRATVEKNSQNQTIIRDYRTGRVISTVGK